MSETKVVVPEGMLKAIREAEYGNPHFDHSDAIEAALRWLAENPIVPSDEQKAQLARDIPYEDSGNGNALAYAAVEWQRRMFLAPERDVQTIETPFGRIVLDPRVPPGEIRLENWDGPTVMRNIKVEPDVPEAIKDLILDDKVENGFFRPDVVNQRMIECYRRGQQNQVRDPNAHLGAVEP